MGLIYVFLFVLGLIGFTALMAYISSLRAVRDIVRKFSSIFYIFVLIFETFLYYSSFFKDDKTYTALILLVVQLVLIMCLQFIDPGAITVSNQPIYSKQWPCDGILYSKKTCKHLGFESVARSHYMKARRERIARFSHFSLQASTPIGYRNYRIYLLFLIVTVASSALMCSKSILVLITQMEGLKMRPKFGKEVLGNIANFLASAFTQLTNGFIDFLIYLMTLVFSLVPLIKHVYLTSLNLTPRESYKMSVLNDVFRHGKLKEKPVNKYDKGIRENWKEVLFIIN